MVIIVGIVSLLIRGLNFGIDFTGGTLVEVSFDESVRIEAVRDTLKRAEFDDALVQYFGTSRDIMVRLPAREDDTGAKLSIGLMEALRKPYNETLAQSRKGAAQQCVTDAGAGASDCRVQMRRVEFVGPQVGKELTEKGGLAMIYALIGILIYVAWRFEWRFAIGSVVALIHDVLVTLGLFSLLHLEFSLPVLAAILAVIGYSLNDTIVVFDRVRENFRKIRRGNVVEIMDRSINQTLPRTLLTSVTTLLVLLALFILGGEVIHGFATALIIGVIVGTYSSIFVASPVVLALGVTREDMMPVKKEGADQERVAP
jgi:preprotein translocase subunit SecF